MTSKTSRVLFAAFIAMAAAAPFSKGAAATTITDHNGRQVVIPNQVNRVATLIIPAGAMLIAVDRGPQRLVGIHKTARQEIVDGLLGQMMPETKSIPSDMSNDNFMPNVEALLAARPDVVLQWGDKGSAIIDPITALGIPVVTLRYGSSELVSEWLRLMGLALTGREARGRELAASFLATRAEVAKTAARIPENRRPRVAYLYRAQGNAFQIAGKKTSMDSDIQLAGGINVAGDVPGFTQISAEQLLAWAPDVVLLNNFEKGMQPSVFYNNQLLAALPAVRDKRVYVYPQGGFRWDPPSHESPLSWQWLLTLFHPELQTKSLRKEIVKSYQLFYGYTPTASDLDVVLRLTENGTSLHYLKKFSRTGAGP